jgi:hypothetical protein
MDLATFRAIFSQTHLVTLFSADGLLLFFNKSLDGPGGQKKILFHCYPILLLIGKCAFFCVICMYAKLEFVRSYIHEVTKSAKRVHTHVSNVLE